MDHPVSSPHPLDAHPARAAHGRDEAGPPAADEPSDILAAHEEVTPAPRAREAVPDGDHADDDRDEEARLARQLAAILARPPRRSLPQPPARTRDADDAVDVQDEDADVDDEAVTALVTSRRYATALHCAGAPAHARPGSGDLGDSDVSDDDPAQDEDGPGAATGDASAARRWLEAARRRRTLSKLGAAASWLATVGIGLVIVWVAASVVFGDVGLINAFNDTTQRPL